MSDKEDNNLQDACSSLGSNECISRYTNDAVQIDMELNIQRGNPYDIVGDLYVFILFIMLEIFINYDIGSMAIMVNYVRDPYKFSETELGTLGALPFFGLVIITAFSGKVLLRFKAQFICSLGLAFNLASIALLAVACNKPLFYISRFMIGITQSIFVIYAPVWVDTYSPLKYRTLWMGFFQGSIIIGTVVGYALTAVLGSVSSWGWRYSFCLQGIGLFILLVLYAILPGNKVNLPFHLKFDNVEENPEKSNSAFSSENVSRVSLPNIDVPPKDQVHDRRLTDGLIYDKFHSPSILGISKYKFSFDVHNPSKAINTYSLDEIVDQPTSDTLHMTCTASDFFAIFKNGLYLPIIFTLCALYFELTGIQFWITSYLIRVCKASESLVYTVFSITAITSPTFGVIFGSAFVDYFAGYDEKLIMRVYYIVFVWSLFCVGCGIIVIIFRTNFYILVVNIWIVLFFGGCIVPPVMVLSINCLEPKLRTLASSIGAAMYNIFGYMLGSVLPGYVADLHGDFTTIIFVIFLWAIFGSAGMVVCICVKHYQQYKAKKKVKADNV